MRNLKPVGRFLQMVRTSATQGNDEEGKSPNLGVQVPTGSGTRDIVVPLCIKTWTCLAPQDRRDWGEMQVSGVGSGFGAAGLEMLTT